MTLGVYTIVCSFSNGDTHKIDVIAPDSFSARHSAEYAFEQTYGVSCNAIATEFRCDANNLRDISELSVA
jgi:hypothetical protein